jgi:tRNA threonylcarbamoyladenosine biosynthesis protein TsaE
MRSFEPDREKTYQMKTLADLSSAATWILDLTKGQTKYAFYGTMGAGKTTLIREICRQLDAINIVTSPTFSIVNEYPTVNGRLLYHFDFYRINQLSEAFDFGYEEYFFSEDFCFIEWPEKIEELLPPGLTRIGIALMDDDTRIIKID